LKMMMSIVFVVDSIDIHLHTHTHTNDIACSSVYPLV